MRLSCDATDPGHKEWLRLGSPAGRTLVFVDGVQQRRVITADEEAGFVEKFSTNENGHMRVDYAKNEAIRETMRGVVRIEVRPK
jgi:hypothetical protein